MNRKNKISGMYKGIRHCSECGKLIDIGYLCQPCKNLELRIIRAGGPEAFIKKHSKTIKRTRKKLDPTIAAKYTSKNINEHSIKSPHVLGHSDAKSRG